MPGGVDNDPTRLEDDHVSLGIHDTNCLLTNARKSFLINNDGFTIERCIHGMNAEYNDIAKWRYTEIPGAFGATGNQAKSFTVETKNDLEKLLENKDFNEAAGLQFVELKMDKEDAPRALKLTAENSARTNARTEGM